jgi:HTH-type transcriptional regulator, competence development regulator
MKLTLTKDWFVRRAALEADIDVAAGLSARNPSLDEAQSGPSEARLAFGPLVQLMRRKNLMSMEKLAEEARVDLVEIVGIERDPGFRPEPRTVHQIAKVLNLPAKSLLQLSGNTVVRDDHFREEAVRFAARSGSVERLSPEERRALEEYVAFLSEQK